MGKRAAVHRQNWPAPAPKASIVLVHGQGEHAGRYAYAAAAWNARGYSVYSGDWPGHGRSAGLRGHIDSFDEYVALVGDWVTEARAAADGRPVFLLGHSVGGVIALRYLQTAADAPITGLVLSSPALRLRFPVPAWKAALGRQLDRVLPKLRMPSGLKQQRVTRNEPIASETVRDPLMVYVASVRFYNELLRAQQTAMWQANRIRLPVLLLQGGADEIVEPEQSLEIGRRLASTDKDVRLLPELHHEIINEPERDAVLSEIADWLDRHI